MSFLFIPVLKHRNEYTSLTRRLHGGVWQSNKDIDVISFTKCPRDDEINLYCSDYSRQSQDGVNKLVWLRVHHIWCDKRQALWEGCIFLEKTDISICFVFLYCDVIKIQEFQKIPQRNLWILLEWLIFFFGSAELLKKFVSVDTHQTLEKKSLSSSDWAMVLFRTADVSSPCR